MSHRFPIQDKVFPPLQLSDSAKDKLVNTALMQLTRALRDYDKYQQWQASRPPSLRYQLHPAMWKPVKTSEQLTVYRRVPADDAVVTAPSGGSRRRARSRTLEAMRLAKATGQDSVSSAPKESVTDADAWPWPNRGSGPPTNSDWSMPTLLQVGTIEGTLDDVMYGTATFDGTETLIKSSYTAEEVVDADTLYEFQGPTPEEPFRFLGLKWVVKATSPAVKAFVWPRDLTFIAATGILNRQGGERVGYHLMHSVDLGKGFGPLEGKRIIRGRVSSCFLYRQTAGNAVDVYMKTNFEPNGSVHESVALLSAANSLTYCLKAALCAQNKKLSWLLAHPKTDEATVGSARPRTVRMKKRHDCGVCTRPIGTFSRGHTCRVCSIRACSTCCVKKKLSFPGQTYKSVDQRPVIICTHCLTHARKLDSLDIAKQEVIERERMGRRRGTLRGTELSGRSARSQRRPEAVRPRRGTAVERAPTSSERGLEKMSSDDEKVFHTAPVRRISRTPRQTRPQRKPEPKTAPAWDYNSETDDNDSNDDTVVASNAVLLPVDSQPRKPSTRDTSSRSNCRTKAKTAVKPVATPTPSKADAAIPVAAHRDVWDVDSEAEDEDDYDCSVVSSQAMSMQPQVPATVDDSLPEAVVQYAWGAVVPSPTSKTSSESPAPWPSPPSSPLQSPKPLPKETGMSWPEAQGERATVWTPPTMPQIPRIQAGASTQEVLAQFAELCNAAENVYQAARKHTMTHLEPTVLPTRQTRLDMSAVD
ncbi:unnamed protein product [Phytophthora lilii]|uniref:Unnamed protein product n=1 Tax=Phytophthora lilii TaxID=2077276 RepID=A0A9W6TBH6_9STRA|nr:unnamed protein product [Phytophthora lilii]